MWKGQVGDTFESVVSVKLLEVCELNMFAVGAHASVCRETISKRIRMISTTVWKDCVTFRRRIYRLILLLGSRISSSHGKGGEQKKYLPFCLTLQWTPRRGTNYYWSIVGLSLKVEMYCIQQEHNTMDSTKHSLWHLHCLSPSCNDWIVESTMCEPIT